MTRVEEEPDERPLMPFEEIEGAALAVLRAVELDHRATVHPTLLASVLALRIRSHAPSGCVGFFDPIRRVIRVSHHGEEPNRMAGVGHEIGHYAGELVGWPRPHNEADVDELAARLWIRGRAARTAVAIAGWNARGLLRVFGDQIPAAVVFRRVAVEAGACIVVRSRGRRRVFHPEGWAWSPDAPAWERRWFRAVLNGGVQPNLFGGEVSAFDDPAGGRGAAIILPGDALDAIEASQSDYST